MIEQIEKAKEEAFDRIRAINTSITSKNAEKEMLVNLTIALDKCIEDFKVAQGKVMIDRLPGPDPKVLIPTIPQASIDMFRKQLKPNTGMWKVIRVSKEMENDVVIEENLSGKEAVTKAFELNAIKSIDSSACYKAVPQDYKLISFADDKSCSNQQ